MHFLKFYEFWFHSIHSIMTARIEFSKTSTETGHTEGLNNKSMFWWQDVASARTYRGDTTASSVDFWKMFSSSRKRGGADAFENDPPFISKGTVQPPWQNFRKLSSFSINGRIWLTFNQGVCVHTLDLQLYADGTRRRGTHGLSNIEHSIWFDRDGLRFLEGF
jgi:hypothetical protein